MRKSLSLLLAVLLLAVALSGCAVSRKAESEAPIVSLSQLNVPERKIGAGVGTVSYDDTVAVFDKAQIMPFSTALEGFAALQSGMIDAFSFSRENVEYALCQDALSDLVMLDEPFGTGADIVVGVSRKTECPDLLPLLNGFIDTILSDGTFDDLYDRWIRQGLEVIPDIPEPVSPVRTVRIGTSGLVAPFSYYRGTELTGLDLELIARFAQYANVRVELRVLDFLGLTAALESGELDCVFSNFNATPERAERMDFTKPLYHQDSVTVVRRGRAQTTPESFNGRPVGILTGTIHEKYAQERFPDSPLSFFSSFSDMIAALNSGIIDGFTCDSGVAETLMRETPALTRLSVPVGRLDCAYAFPKTDDGALLSAQMSEYLKKLRAENALEPIHENYLSPEPDASALAELPTGERTLVFATTSDAPPFSYIFDGGLVGYDVELAVGFCREYGYGIRIETPDFSGILPGLVSGRYDFAGNSIVITPERSESVLFSEPNYSAELVLVVNDGASAASGKSVPHYASRDEMQGTDIKLGIEVGSCFEPLTASLFPNADCEYYNSVSDMVYCVSSGELDGFLCDEPVARLIARETPGVTYIPEVLQTDSYAAVFPKTEAGRKLCDEFSDFVRTLKADGTLQRIIDAWISDDRAAQRTDYASLPHVNGLVRMAASGGFQPFGYVRDGELVGLDIDLVIRFCEEKGYALEVDDLNFSAIIPSLGTTCDMSASGFSITEERKEQVCFSEPYYEGGVVMVVKADSAAEPGFFSRLAASFEKTFIREQRWKMIVQGIGTTVYISLFSAVFGTLLGFGICMLRRTKHRLICAVTTAYIRILQGTPLVVILMVLFYLVFSGSSLSGEWVAIVAFSLNFAAYVSEMLRTGIESVDPGQTEAALALGFTRSRAFFKFVMPQAARRFLPVFKGEFISLVKMTSVVGYIAVQDLTKMSDLIRSRTYEAFFPLISTALIYFIISSILSALLRCVELRVEPDRKKRTVKGVTLQ